MKILLVSPLGFPITPNSKYTGIEKLVWYYARELSKTHDTTVMCHSSSVFPDYVSKLAHNPNGEDPIHAEIRHFQAYHSLMRDFDVIHDFSHLHMVSRVMPNMPTLNIFWHAPSVAKYPKAPYNIIAQSKWAAREFKRVYGQEARYQYTVCLDTDLYKLSETERNDRFYTLGRWGEEKGNLLAILLCKELNQPLDIQAARGVGETEASDYEKRCLELCDGEHIKFLGDLAEPDKINVMQTNKALIYATNHPEVTSHKVQECMLCGMPVICPNIGAMPEIVTHGIDGFLCNNTDEFKLAIMQVDKLIPEETYATNLNRFSIETVVADYVKLYEEVAGGLRW